MRTISVVVTPFRHGIGYPQYAKSQVISVPENIPDEVNVMTSIAMRETMNAMRRTANYYAMEWEFRVSFVPVISAGVVVGAVGYRRVE